MLPNLRTLQAAFPQGIEAQIVAIDHVVRSQLEILALDPASMKLVDPKAKAEEVVTPKAKPHRLVFVAFQNVIYLDIVDVAGDREPQKGDKVKVTWTKTADGDGMPVIE